MNDCANAGVRDRLPDLLHERLDAHTRAAIVAHVDGCVDCRAELELLRGVRGMLARQAPRIDINWVAEALPKPPARVLSRDPAPQRRIWTDWRVAAAVTLLVAGGSSMAVLDRGRGIDRLTADTVQLPSADAAPAASPTPASSAAAPGLTATPVSGVKPGPSVATPTPATRTASSPTSASSSGNAPASDKADRVDASDLSLGGSARLENLNAVQLKKLLSDIDQIDATPITEPEPVTLRIDNRAPASRGNP
jgi:hypothetical protein